MPTEKPANGCKKCESLFDQYLACVDDSARFLREYHAALHLRNTPNIEEMRDRVAKYDLTRALAKEALMAHQATHDGKKPATQN